jgi:L-asparaginase II
VLTFALTLERMAHAFARLGSVEGGAAVVSAVRSHPELVRGPGSPDTEVMRALPGWAAKGGAEAVLCAVSGDGIGLALKVEDGSWRALRPAFAAFLERLGLPTGRLGSTPLTNSNGEIVGEIRPRRE